MDLERGALYSTPLSNSYLLPYLLISLASQKHTPSPTNSFRDEYDYIVVGGGPAGSVVASRVAEILGASVLLLEAGPEPPLLTEAPGLGVFFQGTGLDWNYKTVHQKHASNAVRDNEVVWHSGKMLGGSSSFNGMAYVRCNKKNYDDWAAMGAKGWSHKEVYPYFLKLENETDVKFLMNGCHAVGGPINAEKQKYMPDIRLALKTAASRLGYKFIDVNARTQTGFFDDQRNMKNSQRCSPVKGYLVPASENIFADLDIVLNSMVTKIIIEDGVARGVKFYRDGQYKVVKAKREVIVSAGAIGTPKLLMLSGIGPKEELQKWNISVIEDLPVGKNFHDHSSSHFLIALSPGSQPFDVKVAQPENIEEYIATRSGPLASGASMWEAFLNKEGPDPDVDFPDFGLSISELQSTYFKSLDLKPEAYKQFIEPYENRSAIECTSVNIQPRSRGTITLSSGNPFDPPLIDPNYLSNSSDVQDIAEGLKLCKRLAESDPMIEVGAEPFKTLMPGCEQHKDSEDDYFRCYAKTFQFTHFHGVGSAKMGDPKDPTTVVDPELRVKNIKGLRVVDASIMPIIPSGNTNIPVIMVAEKASDMIKHSFFRSQENHTTDEDCTDEDTTDEDAAA